MDRELLRLMLPYPLPDMGFAIVKSGLKQRWTILFWLNTDETLDGGYYYDFRRMLQFRCWWPPVFFYRGWFRRG